MGTDFYLTYGKHNISNENVRSIIKVSRDILNIPPSYPITLFHYEGYWGASNVATLNNNWGGMTWSNNWKEPYTRASGIVVTKGSKRPNIEGGNYIKYKNFEDYFIDWAWLMRRGGIYRVADSKTFDDCIKGMFIYGGANYDYATMGVTNSKTRYEKYLANMKARRNVINQANNNMLDKIDTGQYEWGEETEPPKENVEYPDTVYPVIRDIETLILSVQNKFSDFQKDMFNGIMELLKINLYKFSDNTMGNEYIKIDTLLNNMYQIKPNQNMELLLSKLITDTNKTLEELKGDMNDLANKGNNIVADIEPSQEDYPFFPTTKGLKITSKYGHRGDITGVPNASKFHNGIDIGGGGKNHPVYATQTGKVYLNEKTDYGGNMLFIKHTGDKFHSCYLHLKDKPNLTIGQEVKKGEQIAIMGSTGYSSGIHLHFGISKTDRFNNSQNTIDPQEYLKMKI